MRSSGSVQRKSYSLLQYCQKESIKEFFEFNDKHLAVFRM